MKHLPAPILILVGLALAHFFPGLDPTGFCLLGTVAALGIGGTLALGTTLASTGIGVAGAMGAFGGGGGAGGVGGAGAMDYASAKQLLALYQKQIDQGITEYKDNLGAATDTYRSAVNTSLSDYTGGMDSAIASYKKGTKNAIKNYNKRVNTLTANPVQNYVAPAAQQALAFNQSNAGNFENLAKQLSLGDQATRFSMLDAAIPTWKQARDQAAQVNLSLQKGEIPADVQQQIARDTAYTALSGGFGADSGMGRTLTARDLGTTSLALSTQGQNQSMAWDQLLYNIAVPQQTTGADVMSFSGISGNTAAQAGLAGMAGRLGAAGNIFSGRLGVQNNILSTNAATNQNVLTTSTNASGNIYNVDANAANNIFGARTQTADNITNANLGLLTRQADDNQAAANARLAANNQLTQSIATGVGALGGTLSNLKSPTTITGAGWKTSSGGNWNPNV